MSDNPYIKQGNPYEAYNEYIKKQLNTDPKAQNIARLCYELFEVNKNGKQLLELWIDNFIFNSKVYLNSQHPRDDALYWQGFTDFIRHIRQNKNHHKENIACQKKAQSQSNKQNK